MDWGERERMEMRRENGVGFKRGQHWLILTNGLNQHMGIFGYITNSLINTEIFLYMARVFLESVCLLRLFYGSTSFARITLSFTTVYLLSILNVIMLSVVATKKY